MDMLKYKLNINIFYSILLSLMVGKKLLIYHM